MRRLTPSGSRVTSTPPTSAVPDVGSQQPAQHPDGGRLPGAVAAEEAEDLAAPRRRTTVVDGDELRRSGGSGRGRRWRRRPGPVHRCRVIGQAARSSRALRPSARRALATRARAIELRLQQRDLRVEHLGAGRDAGAEALADHALGLGRGADPVVGGGDGGAARVELQPALRAPRTSPGDRSRRPAPRARERVARGLRALGAAAAAVPQRPRQR